jgi:hypothetical protein
MMKNKQAILKKVVKDGKGGPRLDSLKNAVGNASDIAKGIPSQLGPAAKQVGNAILGVTGGKQVAQGLYGGAKSLLTRQPYKGPSVSDVAGDALKLGTTAALVGSGIGAAGLAGEAAKVGVATEGAEGAVAAMKRKSLLKALEENKSKALMDQSSKDRMFKESTMSETKYNKLENKRMNDYEKQKEYDASGFEPEDAPFKTARQKSIERNKAKILKDQNAASRYHTKNSDYHTYDKYGYPIT